jgi:hypothetical protein
MRDDRCDGERTGEFTITRSVDLGSAETNTRLTSLTVVSSYSRAHIPHIEASESQKADIKRLRRDMVCPK